MSRYREALEAIVNLPRVQPFADRFEEAQQIARSSLVVLEPEDVNWEAVAERLRPCINCGHGNRAHLDGCCYWKYHRIFRIFGACKCRQLEVGNIWPPITLQPVPEKPA